jgi:hypothetical protein
MTTIAYERHFLMLILAAVALPLGASAFDNLPTGYLRLFSLFAFAGALHAMALVASLRSSASLTRRIAFVALAAAFSVAAVELTFTVMPAFAVFPGTIGILFLLLLMPAIGASGYWLLVRWFWLKSLRFSDLIRTVVLIMVTTLPFWFLPGLIMSLLPLREGNLWYYRVKDALDTSIIIGWWASFSASLYWSELRYGKKIDPYPPMTPKS